MQCLKKAILLTCGVLLLLTSYPQGVLIDCALNNYTEKYKVVDKKYKCENDYLKIINCNGESYEQRRSEKSSHL